jgi:hypothetical protein
MSETPQITRRYNYVYDKLVKSDNDIAGMVAYCIYKQHKIEFITKFKKDKGREPSDDECESFFMSAITDTQLDNYHKKAEGVVSSIVTMTANIRISGIEEKMTKEYQRHIREALPPWWHNVLWSVIASFIFSLMGMFFYYQGRMDNKQEAAKPTTVATTDQQAD